MKTHKFHVKSPIFSEKILYSMITAYILRKEPYILWKEPHIPRKTHILYEKSPNLQPIFYGKSPIFEE